MHTFQGLPNSNIRCVLENSGTDSEPCWTLNPPDGKETDVSIGVLPMTLTFLSSSATTSGRIIVCCAGICPRLGFSGHAN